MEAEKLSMTPREFASTLRRIADALDKMPNEQFQGSPIFCDGEVLLGIAVFWKYLRSLFTATPRDSFRREEILVVLDLVSRDTQLFPAGGLLKLIADLEAEEELDDQTT